MIAQELCLENVPGAGAAYMSDFDKLPTTVQYRLRESPLNICVACLIQATRSFAHSAAPSPEFYCEIITHFEKGTIHDLRNRLQSPRYQVDERCFREFYGNSNYPPPNFYDPSYGEPRRSSNYPERMLPDGMAFERMFSRYANGERNAERSAAEERLRQRLDAVFIVPSQYLKD